MDVPLFDALEDGSADEVIVEHFLDRIIQRSGQTQRNVEIDVEHNALRGAPLEVMDADVDFHFEAAQEQASTIDQQVQRRCLVHGPLTASPCTR